MMLPILISVSVAPGSYFACAADGAGAHANTNSAATEKGSILAHALMPCAVTVLIPSILQTFGSSNGRLPMTHRRPGGSGDGGLAARCRFPPPGRARQATRGAFAQRAETPRYAWLSGTSRVRPRNWRRVRQG